MKSKEISFKLNTGGEIDALVKETFNRPKIQGEVAPSGGQVTLGLQNRDTFVEITVSDNGEGIEAEHVAKIFERFYHVDKARSQEKEGTGLGLAIADSIIQSHHGQVNVSSFPGGRDNLCY